jgi:hypothetical protein
MRVVLPLYMTSTLKVVMIVRTVISFCCISQTSVTLLLLHIKCYYYSYKYYHLIKNK